MLTARSMLRSACLLTVIAAASPQAHAADKTLDRTFKVAAGGRLAVTAAAADITVTAGSSDMVVVKMVFTGSQNALDRLTLSAEQTGNDVAVDATSTGKDSFFSGSNRLDGRITVQVPAQYGVEMKTSGGDLSVQGLQGTTRGRTSGGNVRLSQLRGPAKVITSGGDISASAIQGKLEIQTSGGNITAADVQGELEARTSGGNIELRDIVGQTRAQTSGGDIRVQLKGSNQGISASTSGGNIELRLPRDTKATIDASTSGGSVKSDLAVDAKQKDSQRLNATLNGGGETIYARTSGGDVRLIEAR